MKQTIKWLTILYILLFSLNFFYAGSYYPFAHIASVRDAFLCFFLLMNTFTVFCLGGGILIGHENAKCIARLLGFLPLGLIAFLADYISMQNRIPLNFAINDLFSDSALGFIIVSQALLAVTLWFLLNFEEMPFRIATRKTDLRSLKIAPLFLLLILPLNLFEQIEESFSPRVTKALTFSNFGIWHLYAILLLIGITYLIYRLLKNKDPEKQEQWLSLLALALIIQASSKISVIIGDGYNLKTSLLDAIPLYICNIGVYICAIAIFTKSRGLRNIAFFVHAAGAVSVFLYFGKPELSDFQTIISYNYLYFVLVHILLFALSLMPFVLKRNQFHIKNCVISLVYYCVLITAATLCSGLVNSIGLYSPTLGQRVHIVANFAFTQISPLHISYPVLAFRVFGYSFNLIYLINLYAGYVGLFFTHYGIFILIKKAIQKYHASHAPVRIIQPVAAIFASACEASEELEDPLVQSSDDTFPFSNSDNGEILAMNPAEEKAEAPISR